MKPEIVENRFGVKLYRCPRCGRVFRYLKQYQKHIAKHGERGIERPRG